jgi:hypothetical protein
MIVEQPQLNIRYMNDIAVTDFDDSIRIAEMTEIPKRFPEKKRLFGFLNFKKYRNKG